VLCASVEKLLCGYWTEFRNYLDNLQENAAKVCDNVGFRSVLGVGSVSMAFYW
jgi:hypothetical protein